MIATINKMLAMAQHLRERRNQLKALEGETARRSYWGAQEKTEEPTYDVAKVDEKLVEIDKALFEIDAAIKEANAKTQVECDVDFDALLAPIQKA